MSLKVSYFGGDEGKDVALPSKDGTWHVIG